MSAAGANADVVGARQTAAHEEAGAGGSHVGVVRRAYGDREIEVAVLEDCGPLAVPALHHIDNTIAQNVRDEEAAVEENRVRAARRSCSRNAAR